MIGIQNRKKIISLLADVFDIAQNEASYVSWKTGFENYVTDFNKFVFENSSLEYDKTLIFIQKSSKFKEFSDELQNRKETGQSFKKS